MPLRFVVSLILFSFACGVGVNVCGASVAQELQGTAKKPTPTPTPPSDGPNTSNPGGAGKVYARPNTLERSNRVMLLMDYGMLDRAVEGAKKVGRPVRARYRSVDLDFSVCDPTEHEQEDLTGAYSGNIEFPSRKLSGPATLDIKGQRFTLSINGVDLSGDVSSETTCDYTAVAMRFVTPASPENSTTAAESISLRALRIGSSLTLTSVEGQTKFKFAPTSKAAGRRR